MFNEAKGEPKKARKRRERQPIPEQAAILRIQQAQDYLNVGSTAFNKMRQAPDFPPVIVLSERARGYRRSDLDAFIERRQVRRSAA